VDASFGTYQLAEEHDALREAVRALAEKEIAPHAAEVDEQERYPVEARDALIKAGFHAVHIPEAYDARARLGGHVHPDRGGRPGLRVQLPDPAVNKLARCRSSCRARRGEAVRPPRDSPRRDGVGTP